MKLLSLLLLLSAPSVTLASDEAMSRFSDLLRTLETLRNGERLIKRPTIFGSTIDISSLNSGDFYWVDGKARSVGQETVILFAEDRQISRALVHPKARLGRQKLSGRSAFSRIFVFLFPR